MSRAQRHTLQVLGISNNFITPDHLVHLLKNTALGTRKIRISRNVLFAFFFFNEVFQVALMLRQMWEMFS